MLKTLRRIINKVGLTITAMVLFFVAGCNMPAASTPTPDLFATLQASTPLGYSSPIPVDTSTPSPNFNFDTVTETPITPTAIAGGKVPAPSPADGLTGHIVYTCQIFKVQASNQICIMNADGSGFRRLTTTDSKQHFYPSLAPDGQSVLYSAFVDTNNYEIYKMELGDGTVTQLTNSYAVETAPEFSPDGKSITYARYNPSTKRFQIIIADKNGNDINNVPGVTGWDPTWSPDGGQILFASDERGLVQLYTVKLDGKGLKAVTNLPAIRGRSDWSADGNYIVTYSGPAWNREVFIMNADGSNVRQLTPTGGNSQGPSISPDGKWVAFTAYFDNYGDDHGCEIYVIRTDGTDLRRLTNNDYCDYQPRWGP